MHALIFPFISLSFSLFLSLSLSFSLFLSLSLILFLSLSLSLSFSFVTFMFFIFLSLARFFTVSLFYFSDRASLILYLSHSFSLFLCLPSDVCLGGGAAAAERAAALYALDQCTAHAFLIVFSHDRSSLRFKGLYQV
jgi:hypothetical protein